MTMTTEGNNVVPLFKTFEEMQAEHCEIYKQHFDDWHAAYHRWDLINAELANDEGELNKLAGGADDLMLAKSEAARLRKDHPSPETRAMAELAKTLRGLVEKRNDQLYGLGELSKRTMRFASAKARPYCGPAATVTELKR